MHLFLTVILSLSLLTLDGERERASLPASVLSRRETRGRKEGLSGIIVMPWEASSLIASSWGVLGVEQREDSSESVMEEMESEVMSHVVVNLLGWPYRGV